MQKALCQLRNAILEFIHCLLEALHVGLDVGEELLQQPDKLGAVREIDAHNLLFRLVEDRLARIFRIVDTAEEFQDCGIEGLRAEA